MVYPIVSYMDFKQPQYFRENELDLGDFTPNDWNSGEFHPNIDFQ